MAEIEPAGMPKVKRKPGRPSLSNEELLDKALDLFLEKGFAGTSIDAICAAAGMAKRTVYSRYGDKEALFKAALSRAIDEWIVPIDRLREQEGEDFEASLMRIGEILVSNVLEDFSDEIINLIKALRDEKADLGDLDSLEEKAFYDILKALAVKYDFTYPEDKLLELYESNPDFVAPTERRNEVASFVKSGLRDLSVSRTTFDWGVPVPGNDKHVMYVWVDALTNYITAAGFPDESADRWNYWPAIHMIGKDIVRFHAVYWPAFLMSAGLELPAKVFAHGFLLVKGEKMSKSIGNVVDPFALIEAYGLDQVRYFFMREVPFGQDGSYSPESIATRINSDLANGIGNLASRSLSMINKNCDGKMPACGPLTDEDKAQLDTIDTVIDSARAEMANFQIHKALAAIIDVVADSDRYFASQEPWALKKTDPARMETVLYVTAETVRQISILLQPFMPESAGKLLDLLGIPADRRDFKALGATGRLAAGTPIDKPTPVFPRYVAPEEG